MNVILVVEYKHLFEGNRPNPKELLSDIPSSHIIGIMAMINDVLTLRTNSLETQAYLMYNLAQDFPEDIRDKILGKAGIKLKENYEIFNFPFTVEMINRELINFKEDISEFSASSVDTLSIFKAYLSIVEEMNDRDVLIQNKAIEDAKRGGDNIIKLMWPHLMRQYQFTNRPDPRYEINRGAAFLSYLESHPQFGSYAKEYFKSKNCSNYQDYFLALLSLILPHLHRKPSPNLSDYFYRITLQEPEPILDSLVIDPAEVKHNEKKQLDYLGLKEKPIFQFQSNNYIIPYWDFFYNALFTGFVFSFYFNSGIKREYENLKNITDKNGFGKFKGIIGKEFSEGVLFKNTLKKCFSRKHESLLFFNDNDEFNPDCYYRQGSNIFIIEFKDYMLNSEIIQSGSYEIIKNEIDKKFVSETIEKNGKKKTKEKGILQLARNIEKLVKDEGLFWQIDSQAKNKKLKLRNMTIYPIIVQTNIYFDFPGVNDYLDRIINSRLNIKKPKFKRIATFTMIDFRYFEQCLFLFSDGRLKFVDELEHYQNEMLKRRKKANYTRNVDDNFNAMIPFSFIHSPQFHKQYNDQLPLLREAIEDCWNFKLVDDSVEEP